MVQHFLCRPLDIGIGIDYLVDSPAQGSDGRSIKIILGGLLGGSPVAADRQRVLALIWPGEGAILGSKQLFNAFQRFKILAKLLFQCRQTLWVSIHTI